jgi:hypothetical protein
MHFVVIGGGAGVAAVLLLLVASLLLLLVWRQTACCCSKQQWDHSSQAWLSFSRVTISSSARWKISTRMHQLLEHIGSVGPYDTS